MLLNLPRLKQHTLTAATVILLFFAMLHYVKEDIETALIELKHRFSPAPDFHEIADIKQKKLAFFEYLYPLIQDANLVVLKRRNLLEAIDMDYKNTGNLATDDQEFLLKLCEDYNVSCKQETGAVLTELLTRVDIIPPSLIMAQAANESAWGTSRFAQEGNNFFGQWCFVKGCGLIPSARSDDADHEVKIFDSPYQSIRAYIRNINSTKAYNELWKIRSAARENQKIPTGVELAGGLKNYSEREEEYVKEITRMIKGNELSHYNKIFWKEVEYAK